MTGQGKVARCPACRQANRLRGAAPGAPHCGRCGKALPWLVDVSSADFRAAVEESALPVLIDFWAPWCGPCRMVAPSVEKVAAEFAGRLKVAKVNTDENPDLGGRFGVQGIPTLVVVERGQTVDRVTGALQPAALRDWVASRLKRSAAPAG